MSVDLSDEGVGDTLVSVRSACGDHRQREWWRKTAAKVDGFGHRRSARRPYAATDTKVQWTARTVASILSHAVTEVSVDWTVDFPKVAKRVPSLARNFDDSRHAAAMEATGGRLFRSEGRLTLVS